METIDRLASLRFFVSDEADQRRSAVWFAKHSGDSVYLAPRNVGRSYKLSFHPFRSGRDGCDCQVGIKSDAAAVERAAGFSTPKPLRWARNETPDRGILPVARVLFATDFLTVSDPPETDGKPKFAFPLAPPGQALEAVLCYSREKPDALRDRFIASGFTPFGMMSLRCGEFVYLAMRNVTCDNVGIREALKALGHSSPLSGAPNPDEQIDSARAVIVAGRPEDGEMLTLIDVGTFSLKRKA